MKGEMSKLTPTFLLLGVALLVWSVSVSLSNYLSDDLARKEHGDTGELAKRGLSASVRSSEEFSKLDEAVAKDPKNIDAHLARAVAYVETAYATSDGKKLMEAVKSYKDVLDLDAKNPQALLGLASLCLEAGILDKALEYYPKYLEIKPEDLRARADYSLALARADQADKAHEILDVLLGENPDFFPGQMTRAFVFQIEGKIEEAAKQAESAKQYVRDEKTIARVQGFIDSLGSSTTAAATAQASASSTAGASSATSTSVAASSQTAKSDVGASALSLADRGALESYFREHEIIGRKIKNVSWEAGRTMRLDLDNFPVDKMPPFAKAKFLSSVKERFAALTPVVRIALHDADGGALLMEIEAGS